MAVRDTVFTPDFFFKKWIIEAKGKFTAQDRKRVLGLLAELLCRLDPRPFGMLFQKDNKLSKSSNTRYSDWCKEHGIPYAVGWFRPEWLK